MKVNVLCAAFFIYFLGFFSLSNAAALEPTQTVAYYFDALKSGNIEVIKNSVAGEFYQQQKILLEENAQYSNFLKKNYADASFRLENTYQPSADHAVVNITIYFKDGSESPTVFHLKRDDDYTWKIIKEVIKF